MEIRSFEVPGWPNARRCARLETYVVIDETHGAHIVERRSPPCIEKHVGEGFDQTRSRATGSCRGRVVATRFAQRPERLPDTRMGGVRRGDPSRGACRCQGPRQRTHRGIFHRAACQAVGVRIIGSRFQGWATGYLGFNRLEEISSRVAVAALVDFAFGPLGCLHLEFRDRPLAGTDVDGLGFTVQPKKTFELELRRPEDEIWAGFKSTCRTAIRKAQKSGVIVEQASGAAFADEYYAQLHDVFARQSLPPPYSSCASPLPVWSRRTASCFSVRATPEANRSPRGYSRGTDAWRTSGAARVGVSSNRCGPTIS